MMIIIGNNDNMNKPSVEWISSRNSKSVWICKLAPFWMLWKVRNIFKILPCAITPCKCWGKYLGNWWRFASHGSKQCCCAIPSVTIERKSFLRRSAWLTLWIEIFRMTNKYKNKIQLIENCSTLLSILFSRPCMQIDAKKIFWLDNLFFLHLYICFEID